jgi:hypothetical protein
MTVAFLLTLRACFSLLEYVSLHDLRKGTMHSYFLLRACFIPAVVSVFLSACATGGNPSPRAGVDDAANQVQLQQKVLQPLTACTARVCKPDNPCCKACGLAGGWQTDDGFPVQFVQALKPPKVVYECDRFKPGFQGLGYVDHKGTFIVSRYEATSSPAAKPQPSSTASTNTTAKPSPACGLAWLNSCDCSWNCGPRGKDLTSCRRACGNKHARPTCERRDDRCQLSE